MSQPKSAKNVPAFQNVPFPDTLYVHQSFNPGEFDAYTKFDDAEDGDLVAVYQIVKVQKVKHVTTVTLEETDEA